MPTVQRTKQLISILRLRPFDTSTEGGRSKERFRRAGMTMVSAGAARIIAILASLITVPLTYRYLGPEQYGLWMVLASIIAAMGFADLGIGLGLVNAISEAYGKEDRELARTYFASAFGMLLGIATLLAIAGFAAYPFIPWMRLFNVKSPAVAAEGARALLVLYAWFVVNIPLDVASRVQTGFQKGYISQTVRMLGSLATLAALVMVIALHGSLVWLVFGSTVGNIVSTVVNIWVLFHHDPWLFPTLHDFHFDAAKKILQLGLMFFVLQCAFAVSYNSDNIVITQVLGAAAVAAYAVPQKLFAVVSMVIGMAIMPLWPAYGEAIARGDVAWVRRAFLNSLWATIVISIAMSAVLVIAGRWILTIAVGKSFQVSFALLIVLAIWGVINSVSVVTSALLNGAGVLKPQMGLAITVGLTNISLSILFTRRFGVMGVCLGSIVAQLLITFPTYAVLIPRLFANLRRENKNSTLEGMPNLA